MKDDEDDVKKNDSRFAVDISCAGNDTNDETLTLTANLHVETWA